MSDLVHLSRSIRRSPASAIAAILTLTLTIATGASIFAVVDAVVLTPPPYENPDALVTVVEVPLSDGSDTPRAVRYSTFQAWRQRASSFAALEGYDGTNLTLTGLGNPERVSATDVTPDFLALLGVRPAIGRTFAAGDVGEPVVIVSDAFWRGRLASDPNVVGRQLVLNGRSHTIVGVLPEFFTFALNTCDIWRALPVVPGLAANEAYRLLVIARLERATTPGSLVAMLDDVSRASSPPARVVSTNVTTAIAGNAKTTLGILAAAAALALVVAFINLAGLLIVRAIDRRRELAVRSALGAGQSQIAKQLLIEAMALVAVGALGGVLLARRLAPAAGQLWLQQFGGVANHDVVVNWQVTAAIGLAAFACAGICGIVPAVQTRRWSVVTVLRRGATPSPREVRSRRVLVVAEVAVAFVLLVSLALLGRTLLTLLNENPGFDARDVLALQVSLPTLRYPDAQRQAAFYSDLQVAIDKRLGSSAVSIVDEIPLTGDRGRAQVGTTPAELGREAVVRSVSSDYFEVMRIPVLAGRSFDTYDDAGARPRVAVSRSLARTLFPSGTPIGGRVWLAGRAQPAEVVAVVGDVKHRALDEAPLPTVYLSALQVPSPSSVIVVRAVRNEADVIAAVRAEVARLDPNLPVYRVRSFSDIVATSPGMAARRLLTTAFAGFGLLALLLSAIGLFGVAAHDVACRRTEFAIRMALGADPMRILVATLRQGGWMVGSGLAMGWVLSIWTTQVLGATVIAPAPADITAAGFAAAILIVTGVCAVLPAARRAARTDPLMIIREQ